MTTKQTGTNAGDAAAKALHEATRQEERDVERAKGSDLKKGKDRIEERSRSSDGRSAGEKQDLPAR
ncbi:MAG: hypothetical protein KL863_16355 [Rhizobium sp.]|nr:hypothetical protein [Rhizobium sp.]MBX9457449.1 hypothetical protein [Rhizobium sp.]